MAGFSIGDLQQMLNQMGYLRKVAIGRVVLNTTGWKYIPYKDVLGNTITFSEIPSVSASMTGVSGTIGKPNVSINISVPQINLGSISTPTIPTLTLPTLPLLSPITVPEIAKQYTITLPDGKVISGYTRSKVMEDLISYLTGKFFGDWGALNWLRDKITWFLGGPILWLAYGMMLMTDSWEGNNLKGQLQETVNRIFNGDGRNPGINGIIRSINENVIGIPNTGKGINGYTFKINNWLYTYTTNVNTWITDTKNKIQDGINTAAVNTATALKSGLENGLQAFVDSLWKLIGIAEKGLVFQPVILGDVKREGFWVYSTGKGAILYFIAVGK